MTTSILKMTTKKVLTTLARFLTLRTFNILVSQASLVLFMGFLIFLMELWRYFRAVVMTSCMTTQSFFLILGSGIGGVLSCQTAYARTHIKITA